MTKAYLRRRKSSPANIAGMAGTLLDNVQQEGRRAMWNTYTTNSQQLILLLKKALGALKHLVPHPIPQPP